MAETTVMICWVVLKKVPTIEEQLKVTTMVIAIVMIELLLPKILLPIEVIPIGCIVWTLAFLIDSWILFTRQQTKKPFYPGPSPVRNDISEQLTNENNARDQQQQHQHHGQAQQHQQGSEQSSQRVLSEPPSSIPLQITETRNPIVP